MARYELKQAAAKAVTVEQFGKKGNEFEFWGLGPVWMEIDIDECGAEVRLVDAGEIIYMDSFAKRPENVETMLHMYIGYVCNKWERRHF